MSAEYDAIMAYDDIESEVINLWGIDIELRGLTTEAQMQSFEREDIDPSKDPQQASLVMVAACCYIPGTDDRMFTLEQVQNLYKRKSVSAFSELLSAANRVTGSDQDDLGKDSSD